MQLWFGVAVLVISVIGIGGNFYRYEKTIDKQALIISGQESIIASYKENLTSCLKDSKIAAQDEFTGE